MILFDIERQLSGSKIFGIETGRGHADLPLK